MFSLLKRTKKLYFLTSEEISRVYFFQKDRTNDQNSAVRPLYLINKSLKIVTILISCLFVFKIIRKVC